MKAFYVLFSALVSIAANAQSPGFGSDNIFGTLNSPNLYEAKSTCARLNIVQGIRYSLVAQEDLFGLQNATDLQAVFTLQVPSEGTYVFAGSPPSRITNKLLAPAFNLAATRDEVSGEITIRHGNEECVLHQCKLFDASCGQ